MASAWMAASLVWLVINGTAPKRPISTKIMVFISTRKTPAFAAESDLS